MKHEYNTFWFLLKKRKTSRGCNFSSVSLKHWESLWLRNGVLQVLPCNRVIMGSLLLESQIFLHPLKTLSLKVYHSSNMFSPFSPPTPASLLYLLHFFLIFFLIELASIKQRLSFLINHIFRVLWLLEPGYYSHYKFIK